MNVETGITGLKEEAAHAEKVREKGRVLYMYLCLLIEFIILMILIFVAFIK